MARKTRRLKPTRDQNLESRELKQELRTHLDLVSGRHEDIIWDGSKPLVGPDYMNNPFRTMSVNFID